MIAGRRFETAFGAATGGEGIVRNESTRPESHTSIRDFYAELNGPRRPGVGESEGRRRRRIASAFKIEGTRQEFWVASIDRALSVRRPTNQIIDA